MMNLLCKAALCAVLGVAGVYGVAMGQPIADKPEFKVGDYWEFRRTTTSTTTPGDEAGKWTRKIIELRPDSTIRTQRRDGVVHDYDSAMNALVEHGEGSVFVVRYPLQVGAQWSFSYKRAPTEYTMNTEAKGTAKVVAYESITVPAGTFECFRVDVETSYGVKTYSLRRWWSRWYCPKMKWFAKERKETYVFTPYGGGGKTKVDESELVKFKPGK